MRERGWARMEGGEDTYIHGEKVGREDEGEGTRRRGRQGWVTERMGVRRGKKVEREAKKDNWSMKKRGGSDTDTTERGEQGQVGNIR